MYRIGYWIGSLMSRGNGTYRVTAKAYNAQAAIAIKRYYEECGYIAELLTVL